MHTHLQRFLVAFLVLCTACAVESAADVSDGSVSEADDLRSSASDVRLEHQSNDPEILVLHNSEVSMDISAVTGKIVSVTYAHKVVTNRSNPSYLTFNGGVDERQVVATVRKAAKRLSNGGIDVSFLSSYKQAKEIHVNADVPLDIAMHYVMLPGESGFYVYYVLTHHAGDPGYSIGEFRHAFMVDPNFTYLVVADDRHRTLPTVDQLVGSYALGPKEATKVTDQKTAFFDSVEDKYHYSVASKDDLQHGRAGTFGDIDIGFWIISPAKMEYVAGGPFKQDLTTHESYANLMYLHSGHYGTPSIDIGSNESWAKTYGPFMVYFNQQPTPERPPLLTEAARYSSDFLTNEKTFDPQWSQYKPLWEGAKRLASYKKAHWPYTWLSDDSHTDRARRVTVAGKLVLRDGDNVVPAPPGTWLGLGPRRSPLAPGAASSTFVAPWSSEGKGYQFWTQLWPNQHFNFGKAAVIPGSYTLYAVIPGVIGEVVLQEQVDVPVPAQDSEPRINLGKVHYSVPRFGKTYWQIGRCDRDSAEFFVPNLHPTSPYPYSYEANPNNRFRSWGIWNFDSSNHLNYSIGQSSDKNDWLYAQMMLPSGQTSVRKINFNVSGVDSGQTYALRLPLAGFDRARLTISLNEQVLYTHYRAYVYNNITYVNPYFNGVAGNDALIRAGSYANYAEISLPFSGSKLVNGRNTISLEVSGIDNFYTYIAYDCIRLEGP